LLTTPLPWRLASEDGGGVLWAPALDVAVGTLRWIDPEVALDWTTLAPPLQASVRQWAARIASLGLRDGLPAPVHLDAGELIVIDNRHALHARTAIGDPASSARRMLRVRIR